MIARDITRVSLLTLAVAWVLCADVERARAESELIVSWPAPAGCPDRAWLERRVEAQLGRALAAARVQTLEVSATIAARLAGGYTLSLRTRRGDELGERTLEAASCQELAEAAALLIALSVEADGSEGAPNHGAAPSATAPGATAPSRGNEQPDATGPNDASALEPAHAPSRASSRASQQPDRGERSRDTRARAGRSPRLSLRAAGALERGTLPRIAAGAELALALALGRSHVELSAFWLPGVRSRPAADESRVRVALWTARAAYCHDLVGVRARLASCVGIEAGRVAGRGEQLDMAHTESFGWYAAWLSLRLTVPLATHLALVFEPALALPFSRRRFVSRDAQGNRVEKLHTPSAYSVRGGLGLELAF